MRTDNPEPSSGEEGPTGGGTALFRLVRYWSRRWTAQAAQDISTGLGPVGHILLLEAVDAAGQGGPAAIADVASQLGLDRSNASRLLADAVTAGLVSKRADPRDARRAELTITPSGEQLLGSARAWQERVFAELVSTWPKGDARRFARYLRRLADEQATNANEGRSR